VAEFRRFVKATGHRTTAEAAPSAEEFPDADPAQLVPGSLVFRATTGPVRLDDYTQWWAWTPGADWRHPEGPASTVAGRDRHPVTHVSLFDAQAYAAWAGKELPTETEWEYAARGGLDGARFAWGDEELVHHRRQANSWQGEFPWQNLLDDGFLGTSPIGSFPPNGYGLVDVTGNTWEWTADPWTADHTPTCCAPANPVSAAEPYPRRVVKGGSHLCAPSYCLRYRPAARQGQTEDTSTGHLGFRCLVRVPG
jgi:formylglycine-generating enzyme required for sulfatase activity